VNIETKFCVQVDRSESQPVDDKPSPKGACSKLLMLSDPF